jgi:hypothetical protein
MLDICCSPHLGGWRNHGMGGLCGYVPLLRYQTDKTASVHSACDKYITNDIVPPPTYPPIHSIPKSHPRPPPLSNDHKACPTTCQVRAGRYQSARFRMDQQSSCKRHDKRVIRGLVCWKVRWLGRRRWAISTAFTRWTRRWSREGGR